MVETTYHPRNKSTDGTASDPEEFLWIVEPSQDGSLYGYTPGAPFGMQRLGLTVKQLVELSPYQADDPPLVYIAEKKNTLYTLDVSNGKILKMFSTGGSAILDEESCRKVSGLENLEDEACGVTGTVNLGRVEYTVKINSKITSEPICTIKYSEWGPNNRDRDLINQYASSKDDRYIYSRFDGSALALEHQHSRGQGESYDAKPTYLQKFPSPVARVFDIARSIHDTSADSPLIVLPQPVEPMYGSNMIYNDPDRVFVNCTESGSWYALSEDRYPMVTDGAFEAPCAQDEWHGFAHGSSGTSQSTLKKGLVGVHGLSSPDDSPHDAPHIPLIGAPPEESISESAKELGPGYGNLPMLPGSQPRQPILWIVLCLTLLFALIAPTTGYHWTSQLPFTFPMDLMRPSATPTLNVPATSVKETLNTTEGNAVHNNAKTVTFEQPENELLSRTKRSISNVSANDLDSQLAESGDVNALGEDPTPKKPKAHRGKRGGKKLRDKREGLSPSPGPADTIDSTVEGVKQQGRDVTVKPDVVSKHMQEESRTKGLHNLHIHTDRVLGNGSGGTFVFEGQFEGRDVAVKRMLPQYFELASQEVTLLEQNEEHANVIRYFCRREDQHFLYIALELCQASLWDLFKDGRRDEASEDKLDLLSREVMRDPRRVLRQLAEGIKYLHNFRIVHRDIKPQNMLIAYPKKKNMGSFPRFVISDFGLCKTLPDNASTLIGTTGNAGTAGWKAPELILQPRETNGNGSQHSIRSETGIGQPDSANGLPSGIAGVKRAVDIFSLGCVFFYVLTHGQHPFDDDEGWMQLRERNIKNGRANLAPLELLGPDTLDLVKWMLEHRPEDRPTAAQVLAHPFFWDAEDRLEFLSVASDRFDQEQRDGSSTALRMLESHAEQIIPSAIVGATSYASTATHGHLRASSDSNSGLPHGMASTMPLPIREPNFLAALDRRFVDTLGRQRKYDPGKLVDLLRALRNKHHHWDDMPDEVKAKVGEVPEGYLQYWEGKFPGLVVKVWRVVAALGISNERRFARWFSSKGN